MDLKINLRELAMVIAENDYIERKATLLQLDIEALKSIADEGDAVAQNVTGLRYLEGRGVERNPALAFDYFMKSANQGFDRAKANVGVCYAEGDGVLQDTGTAFSWLRQASQQGNEFASEWIRYLAQQRAHRNPRYLHPTIG